MMPLLWKEYRELRTTLLVWLACLLIVQVLRQFPAAFAVSSGAMGALFRFIGVLSAVALGSELLTRERQARTLDYLLARPVSAGRIVWVKFTAGSIALLVFVAALLALVFLPVPQADPSEVRFVELIRQAGYFTSLVAVYPRFWFVLAFTLAVSTLAGTRAKAATAALLVLVGCYWVLYAASQWRLWLDPEVWVTSVIWDDAHLLLTESPALLSLAAGVWCGLAIAAAALAATLFARQPNRNAGWLLVVVASAAFSFLAPYGVQKVRPSFPSIPAVGVYSLGSQTGSLLAADGSRVCVVAGERLVGIDFSNPARPRQSAEVRLPPLWKFSNVQLRGTRVMLAGRRREIPDDRAAVLVLDLASPEKQVVATLGVADESYWIGRPEEVGGYLYAGVGSMWRSTLRVFELTGETAARETAALTIEEPRDPSTRFVGAPQFGMCVRGDYAYFALTGTLATLDVRDPAHPRLVGRTEIAPAAVALYGAPQQVAIAGNRLYVQGLWPRRLRSFDLTNPARPTRAEEYDWRLRPGAVLGTPGGSLAVYLPRLNDALMFAPRPGLWPGRVRQLGGGPEGTPHPHRMTGVAFGDYVYALIDEERVAAFPLAGGV